MAAASPFQPLIFPTDRMVRHPIRPWQENLCHKLANVLAHPEGELHQIAGYMNLLALLEAYQGNNANSFQLCESQILFWRNRARQTADLNQIGHAIQPWINIIRLDRWQNNMDRSTSLYAELAPDVRDADNSLTRRYGVEYSFNALCTFQPASLPHNTINHVYWLEYGRQLLACGANEQLQTHLQQGLQQPLNNFLKLALLEMLVIYQCRLGKYEKALSLLAKLNISPQSWAWLPFKVLEMTLHLTLDTDQVPQQLEQVFGAVASGPYIKKDGQGLSVLLELCRICKEFHLQQQELQMLEMTRELALALNDEVVQFEVMHRQAALQLVSPEQVLQRFQHSQYSMVQKKLGMRQSPNADANLRRADSIVRACRQMAELDIAACIETLNQEFAFEELSAA